MAVTSTDLVTSVEDLAYSNSTNTTTTTTRGSSELGKEEFLQLLVTQLQNQDPLNPEEDTEFISQLAQFSSLEQMTNMNTTMSNTSAYSMVGKEVIVSSTDSSGASTEVRGVVDYVEMLNGDAYLSIDGQTYSMDDLVKVMDTAYAAQDYLPSVEEQAAVYDKSSPSIVKVKLDLGSNGYEASSVAISLNGNYISTDYLQYDADDNIMTILPGAFENLSAGKYALTFYFDDPYSTTVTDKVSVQVLESGITGSETDSDE
jgi:flagellar basal-body rod modification protein FlgD